VKRLAPTLAVVAFLALGAATHAAADDQKPKLDLPEPKSLVGVYVDAEVNGLTTASVNCGRGRTFEGDQGDLTFLMANEEPQVMTCVIVIRREAV